MVYPCTYVECMYLYVNIVLLLGVENGCTNILILPRAGDTDCWSVKFDNDVVDDDDDDDDYDNNNNNNNNAFFVWHLEALKINSIKSQKTSLSA
jgi:hypothetical protein